MFRAFATTVFDWFFELIGYLDGLLHEQVYKLSQTTSPDHTVVESWIESWLQIRSTRTPQDMLNLADKDWTRGLSTVWAVQELKIQ